MLTEADIKLKVCGMRNLQNISEVAALRPDFMGFIFYRKSPRYVEDMEEDTVRRVKNQGIEPVAVFVNEDLDCMLQLVEKYGFTHLQLHGSETPETCAVLKSKGFTVVKAFSVAEASDLEVLKKYESSCDFFLFDTKTKHFGGSGQQFDWEILNAYSGSIPFFLSGGIGPDDTEKIKTIHHPQFFGIDLNSRFETQPALKDATLLKNTIDQLIFIKQTSNAK